MRNLIENTFFLKIILIWLNFMVKWIDFQQTTELFQTQIVFQHYVISNSERYFKEPSKFLPERWLKTSRECHHPFASLPFGYGRRMCLGRRFADLELQTITAKVHHHRIKKQMYYFVLSALLGAVKPYTPSINIPG